MNLLTMVALAVLAPGAYTENTDTWVQMTSETIEIASTPEAAARMKPWETIAGAIQVKCKALKINVTAEGKVIECERCSFSTWTGRKGTANLAVLDQAKGILTLTGDDAMHVELIAPDQNGETKIVSNYMQIKMLRSGDDVLFSDPPADGRAATVILHEESARTRRLMFGILDQVRIDRDSTRIQKATRDQLFDDPDSKVSPKPEIN